MKTTCFAVSVLLAGLVALACAPTYDAAPPASAAGADDKAIARAFQNGESGVQVQGQGKVIRILADDTSGDRHQRFILRLASGQTLLVAHNIDIAPRVEPLDVGDAVAFYGIYEWSEKGGTVHWTHKDPSGRHEAGWLKRGGRTYQ